MKEVMKDYFEKFIDKWMEYNKSLPQIAWNEDVDEFIYSGEEDEYGYISWKPIERENFPLMKLKVNITFSYMTR